MKEAAFIAGVLLALTCWALDRRRQRRFRQAVDRELERLRQRQEGRRKDRARRMQGTLRGEDQA